jgi:hypothetical protein
MDWFVRWAMYLKRNGPYVFLFSRMKVNGSELRSQWYCASGLYDLRWVGANDWCEKEYALDTPIVPEIL